MRRAPPVHFYLLDIVRGLAALGVVLWHYQHFFFQGTPAALPIGFERSAQPFYGLLSLFYNEGSRAVQLFFVLSGFIFFSQYLRTIQTKSVGFLEYSMLRISRLYPLYVMTLLVVAIGQWIALHATGSYIVYPCNSLIRFFPSLFFVSEWFPQRYVCSVAFNGPGWSLSVEIFLYVAFFLFARFLAPFRPLPLAIATVLAVGLGLVFYTFDLYHLMGEPLLCFFAGGAVYLIWAKLHAGSRIAGVLLAMVMGIAAIMCTLIFGLKPLVLDGLAFPAIVLLLAVVQTGQQGRALKIIGDITYPVYLLHFPIQLYVMLGLRLTGFRLDFYSPVVWFGFFGTLVLISAVSYEYFERPAQRYLRRLLIRDRDVPKARAASELAPTHP